MRRSARPPSLKLTPAPNSVDAESLDRAKIEEQYELEAKLGTGSSAVIHKAWRRSDGQYVAFKCYQSCQEEEIRVLAKREYDVMHSLQHASILAVEEIFDLPATIWVRMEFCETGTLETFVEQNGTFSERHACRLSRQLLAGLDFLHGKRIVHRDIKPDNLMLQDEGWTLKIGDFGSAKHLSNGSAMLTHRGTELYSAPELYFAEVRSKYSWNERVDIWSSGICLYFMSHGTMPFNIGHTTVAESLKAGMLPPIKWDHSLSSGWQAVVKMCLVVDPSQRPPALALMQSPFLVEVDAVRQQRTASDPDQSSPTSPHADVHDWMESRTSIESLRKVASNMSRQISEETSGPGAFSSSSSDTGAPEASPADEVDKVALRNGRRRRKSAAKYSKFLTTHCGQAAV